jgi:ABC-type glycerol-3-phosphate transport system substrate-binding protein
MFEEAGLKYKPEWKTWEELVADAVKMTKVQDGVMTVAGFHYVTGDGLGFLFWEGVLERGAEYFAEDKVHLNMKSPEAEATVQWLTDMAQKDKVVDPLTFNGGSNWVGDSFFQGLVAIGYIGPGSYPWRVSTMLTLLIPGTRFPARSTAASAILLPMLAV